MLIKRGVWCRCLTTTHLQLPQLHRSLCLSRFLPRQLFSRQFRLKSSAESCFLSITYCKRKRAWTYQIQGVCSVSKVYDTNNGHGATWECAWSLQFVDYFNLPHTARTRGFSFARQMHTGSEASVRPMRISCVGRGEVDFGTMLGLDNIIRLHLNGDDLDALWAANRNWFLSLVAPCRAVPNLKVKASPHILSLL